MPRLLLRKLQLRRLSLRRLLPCLALVVLAGCAIGPDYARPDLKVPARFRFDADGTPGASLGDLRWWDLYQDPVLQRLIRTAMDNNADVRIAAARLTEARALAGAAGLAVLPQVSAQVAAQRSALAQDELRAGQPRMGTLFQAQAALSWEIDLWGRLRRAREAARADLLSTEFARRAVRVGLVSDVASTWFQLITLHEELAITRRTVDTRQKLVDLTRAKHDRGVISGLDVASAEAQLAAARVAIPQQELELARTEHQLAILLGGYPEGIELPQQAAVPGTAPVPPPGLPASLIERRPDVLESEQALVAANARAGAAKALLLPTLSLTGEFGRISTDLSRLFTPQNEAWSVTGGLLQPLLDPQRSVYTKRAADARRQQALAAYAQSVQRALGEVADALIARVKQGEIEAAQRDQVEALRRASTIAHARYDVGTASYVDVTNADRDLFGAELSLVTASRDRLLATVQLYRALGGGWQEAPTPPVAPAASGP
ncbi:MAG: efflux transporter outer membrane subunit [Steroidobacteraceae bacterium]